MPVLLQGETGTGKTYLAEQIHRHSSRAQGPFVPVNCATLPPTLIESALFGHERGAYTDAKDSSAGLIENADNGTLFLDEIAELPPDMQPKLLAALDDLWIRRVGGTRRIRVNARVITATNQNLAALMSSGKFRHDLYYRCCGLPIQLPPVRERRREIRPLIEHILLEIGSELDLNDDLFPEITVQASKILLSYPWPGNVREMKNVLRFAVLNADGAAIGPKHLPDDVLRKGKTPFTADAIDSTTRQRKSRYIAPDPAEEHRNIIRVLRCTAGNRTQAAQRLGMSRQVLWERIRLYRIKEAHWANSPDPLTSQRTLT